MTKKIFLHEHPEFLDLIRIVADKESINDPALVEKDYWIMHCLYGLQQNKMQFELKGGTSLCKGYRIINRFSEDIDIRIEPPEFLNVKAGKNQNKPAQIDSRKDFYGWLAKNISINGVFSINRDEDFDDEKYRSGGLRLNYQIKTHPIPGLKDGILLEVGFDDTAPNLPKNISSWVYDYIKDRELDIIDNRAKNILCYDYRYTFVEKLQAISTKYRKQQESGVLPKNFIRHYYDVYSLLGIKEVQDFIGTEDYKKHKEKRFRKSDNPILTDNQAFLLNDIEVKEKYILSYEATSTLYYKDKPSFEEIVKRIHAYIEKL